MLDALTRTTSKGSPSEKRAGVEARGVHVGPTDQPHAVDSSDNGMDLVVRWPAATGWDLRARG